jgi:hypothetical protein
MVAFCCSISAGMRLSAGTPRLTADFSCASWDQHLARGSVHRLLLAAAPSLTAASRNEFALSADVRQHEVVRGEEDRVAGTAA